jgi:predicted nucleotidyltransferase component of viral defense system
MARRGKTPPVDPVPGLARIRELIIVSMFSDDLLFEKVVLKGGNALNLVHRLPGRTSLDVDMSIDGDFDDREDFQARIYNALKDRFDSERFIVFDFRFTAKPERDYPDRNPKWGGYVVEFKIISQADHDRIAERSFKSDQARDQALRMAAIAVGPSGGRKFTVDFSKYEFCDAKTTAELDHFTIYVYTLEMVAIEKLRAICQQLPQYSLRGYSTPRARDFYDIYRIIDGCGIDLTSPQNLALISPIFAAKDVPLEFLHFIVDQRDFHRADWDAVVNSVNEKLRDYDYYFDFVVEITKQLQAAGVK